MTREDPTDVALLRFEIIAPLLSIAGPRGTLEREIHKLAVRRHDHPRLGLIKVGAGTIEEWLLREVAAAHPGNLGIKGTVEAYFARVAKARAEAARLAALRKRNAE